MRIAIANEEPLIVEAIKSALLHERGWSVAWIAREEVEAIRRCSADTPDLVLMDLRLPFAGGVAATRQIMTASPCAVLILTSCGDQSAPQIVDALAAGAVDAVAIPTASEFRGLIDRPYSRQLQTSSAGLGNLVQKIRGIEAALNGAASGENHSVDDLLLVGASAGGPAAFAQIIGQLPASFRAATVLAQHVDSVFVPTMVNWLARQTRLPVRIAQDGERLQRGTIFVADTRMQLVFKDRQHLGYAARSELSPHQPCIDVFFESAAPFRYTHLVAMILTGMGRDGARGLKMLRSAGATTIAQDAGSSVVYGMPKAAAEAGAIKEVLPLEAIAPRLISIFSRK